MTIVGSIVSKILGHAAAAPAPGRSGPNGSPGAPPTSSSFNNPGSAAASPGQSGPGAPPPAQPTPAAGGAPPVDVEKVLTGMAARDSRDLDWRHSIVDLMALLDLDSSLPARQELARELHYAGSTTDDAAMNTWLHQRIMQEVAANGGEVPGDLK